jgi:hypothetical protein
MGIKDKTRTVFKLLYFVRARKGERGKVDMLLSAYLCTWDEVLEAPRYIESA